MKLKCEPTKWAFGGLLMILVLGLSSCATPVSAPLKPGTGVQTILLVRHGAYDESDPRDAYEGKGLTDVGRRQSRLTGKRLAALPRKVDEVYVSPVTRARETAEIACRELSSLRPTLDPDLVEGGPPVTDTTQPAREVTKEEAECRERLERVFAHYFRPSPDRNTTVVLFCHGNVIRYLWGRTLGVDPGIWRRYQVSNGGVTEIRVKPDGKMIGVSYNDVGHLPPELRTFSWKSPMYPP